MASLAGVLLVVAALFANVEPAEAVASHRHAGRLSSGAEQRSAERASRLRKEVDIMKERGTEVVSALRLAADRLDEMLALSAPAANASGKTALRASRQNKQHMNSQKSAALKNQLEVLEHLQAHLKSSIARDNREEDDSKKHNQKMIDELKARLEDDRKKANDTKLSVRQRELFTNDTRLEERELMYWTRGRELQHGMYHANLKMTHGLMSRVKAVMQAYQEVLSIGHLDAETSKLLHAAAASIPARPSPKVDAVAKPTAELTSGNSSNSSSTPRVQKHTNSTTE